MFETYLLLFLILFFVFCLGTVIGSFLNVVILRAFSGESIVLPPSKCPKCGNRLKWWHNIPILSYLLLRGKCYFCHEHISIQYPIVEFITGCVFLAVFIQYGLLPETIFGFIISSLLIVLAVTDIKEKVVFDKHTYSLIAVGLIYNLLVTAVIVYNQAVISILGFHLTKDWLLYNPLTLSVLGLILGVVIMEIAARIGYLLAGERAFGEGDTYIAAGLGAAFGWQNVLVILIMSLLIQLIVTLPLFLKKQFCNKNYGTLIYLTSFLIYAGIFFFVQHKTHLLDNLFAALAATAIMLILGILTCINIFKGFKNREQLTYLPFGPALAIAGIIFLISNFQFSF